MWTLLGVAVDLIHAFAMAVWFAGFPLLFARRWPRVRLGYAIYAVGFILVSQTSMIFFKECILTVLTQWLWSHDPTHVVSNRWFTERLAGSVFGMAPSRHIIARISELMVLATAVGVIFSIVRAHRDARSKRVQVSFAS
jgi:hypothetical protein